MTNLVVVPVGDPVRIGIVGLGAIGSTMLDAAAHEPDVRITRAADLDRATVDRLRPAHPTVGLGTEPLGVLTSPDVDAVYIATPPETHARLVETAVRNGKAVFCEKPLAVLPEDGSAIVTAARTSGLPMAVNFALSDRSAVRALEQLLQAGLAGDIVGVEVRLGFSRWPRAFQEQATWLAGRAQGGFVREVLSHFVYLTDRLVGPLDAVCVGVDFRSGDLSGSEIAAHGLLRAAGVPVHVSGFVGGAGPDLYEWYVWGTRRSYLLRDWGDLFVQEGSTGWVPVELAGERGSEHTRLGLFAQLVRGHSTPHLADVEAAFRVQQVIESFALGGPRHE